ncbi:MAG: class I SAM-dependent RNA methyltransferase, partial [Gemmatimonadaceae bacterium]
MTSHSRRTRVPSAAPKPAAAPPTLLHECFGIVAPGLEAIALEEAQAIGLPAALAEGGGGIEWQGDLRSVLLANATLRITSRVVVRLASFEARSFAELERHARQVPWARVVAAGGAVRFRVTCKKSKLYHSDAVAERFADALTRAVPGVRVQGVGSTEDEGPDDEAQLFVVRILRDRCTVNADTSGSLLHRRGYRQATAKAPLRETLAAALIAGSGWDAASPLVDPFCGSGTIPIEAALMARGIAPGVLRT